MVRGDKAGRPDGWAGELHSLFQRLRMTSGVDPDSGRPPSLRQIAKRSGYVASHVSDVLNGVGHPSREAVLAVAGALGATDEDRNLAAFYAEQLQRSPTTATDGARTTTQSRTRLIPRELPHDIRAFTGRESELARLEEIARGDATRGGALIITAIDGTAGVGKTALAVHFAHRMAKQFPDGQLYANLRGYDPDQSALSASHVLDQFLRSLGADPRRIPVDLDGRVRMYRSMIAGKRMLLLLDNAATADQLRPVLPAGDSSLTLVTSRSRLSSLVAGDGAYRVNIDVLTPSEAVDLTVSITGPERVRSEPDATEQMVRLAGCLPLAVRIVAERLSSRPHLSIADLVSELADERERLNILSDDGDDRMAVRSVFSWSYRNLSADAARLFRLLGLHAGPTVSVPAAAASADLPPATCGRLLETLVAVNLLEAAGPKRYRFHDLLRVYARECAEEDETTTARKGAVERLLTWYLETADTAGRTFMPGRWNPPPMPPSVSPVHIDFSSGTAAIRWCESEHKNLVAATRQAFASGDYAAAWRFPAVLLLFFWLGRHWEDWTETAAIGLMAAEHLQDPTAEAFVLSCLGNAHQDLGHVNEAMDCYTRAMSLWRGVGNEVGGVSLLANLGTCHLSLGDPVRAAELCGEAVRHAERLGERGYEGFALLYLATVYQYLNRHDRVLDNSRKAFEIWQAFGNRYAQASSLHIMGTAHRRLGNFPEAVENCRLAAEIRRELGDRKGAAASLTSLGKALRELGSISEAREAWTTSRQLLEDLGDPRSDDLRTLLGTLPTPGTEA